MSTPEQVIDLPDGQRQTADVVLKPWKKRATLGQEARAEYEGQWRLNEAFAAGNQWMRRSDDGIGRTLYDARKRLLDDGRSILEADVLTQFLWTAIGKLAADDFRPELLAYHQDEEGEQTASLLNKTTGFLWDEEVKGDQRCLEILHGIAVYGTVPVRCRYDRGRGPFLGDVPHVGDEPYTHQPPEGGAPPQTFDARRPILDPAAARAYVADRKQYGEPVDLRPLREGAVTWEVGSAWNMLPPPGVEHAEDFPYDLLVRAVHIDTLKAAYPQSAQFIRGEDIEQAGVLGSVSQTNGKSSSTSKLSEHALVYSGYLKPTVNHPRGQVAVWTGDTVLAVEERMPYQGGPWGPRAGIHYFRYWPVKGRFMGRALIEPGIGVQRQRNKLKSQMDETIDRGQPFVIVNEGDLPDKSGAPMEVMELQTGSSAPIVNQGTGPGPWMDSAVMRCDEDLQKVFGLNDVSVGASASPGTPYASLAQQNENDQTKLGPIIQSFRLGVADLTRDSVEAMGQWPEGKTLMIVGEDDRLEVVVHKRQTLPSQYLVRPAKGGGLPRSQGAELQKISDLWQAALAAALVQQDPSAWWDWLKRSTDAGTAQEPPEMNAKSQQAHKAALENAIMARLGEPVPVAPFDDPAVHVPIHDEKQSEFMQAAELGDPIAGHIVQVIEEHKQQHLAMAQQNQAQAPPVGPAAPPQLSPGAPAGVPSPPA